DRRDHRRQAGDRRRRAGHRRGVAVRAQHRRAGAAGLPRRRCVVSRPRRPYGGDLPGRLQATMIRVLAAELSDQGRLARGKRYWSEGAVVDIVVGHGAVTAEILGSRPDPYVVTLEAAADPSGHGAVPSKRELWIGCTCPDDSGTGAEAC